MAPSNESSIKIFFLAVVHFTCWVMLIQSLHGVNYWTLALTPSMGASFWLKTCRRVGKSCVCVVQKCLRKTRTRYKNSEWLLSKTSEQLKFPERKSKNAEEKHPPLERKSHSIISCGFLERGKWHSCRHLLPFSPTSCKTIASETMQAFRPQKYESFKRYILCDPITSRFLLEHSFFYNAGSYISGSKTINKGAFFFNSCDIMFLFFFPLISIFNIEY